MRASLARVTCMVEQEIRASKPCKLVINRGFTIVCHNHSQLTFGNDRWRKRNLP